MYYHIPCSIKYLVSHRLMSRHNRTNNIDDFISSYQLQIYNKYTLKKETFKPACLKKALHMSNFQSPHMTLSWHACHCECLNFEVTPIFEGSSGYYILSNWVTHQSLSFSHITKDMEPKVRFESHKNNMHLNVDSIALYLWWL